MREGETRITAQQITALSSNASDIFPDHTGLGIQVTAALQLAFSSEGGKKTLGHSVNYLLPAERMKQKGPSPLMLTSVII